jgi:hypothetical protein
MFRLLRRGRFDVVQVSCAYLATEVAVPAALAGTPLVVTLPGGRLPVLPIAPFHHVVCFSRELEDALASRYPRRRTGVWMVGNRIDAAQVLEKGDAALPDSVTLPERPGDGFLLSMTTRMDAGKEGAVAHCLEAAALLRRSRTDFRFLFIGGGSHLGRFREEAARRNEEAGEEYVRFVGPLENPFPVVKRADVVLGVGLSALEGGVFGKPVIIVGENGYAGTVAPETLERLEYFNFSGRNLDGPVPAESLCRELNRLLEDNALRSSLGDVCRAHVTRHLSLDDVSERYEEAYRAAARERGSTLGETARAATHLLNVFRCLASRKMGDAAGTTER